MKTSQLLTVLLLVSQMVFSQDIVGKYSGDSFGGSVSLSGDARTIGVGQELTDWRLRASGCVYAYRI